MMNKQKQFADEYLIDLNATRAYKAVYKIIFSNPVNQMPADDWVKIHMHFTPNIPANLLEETQIVQNLQGLVSPETYLKILSVVDNVKDEIDRMVEEDQKLKRDPVMDQMFQHTHTEEGEANEQ